MPKIAEGRDIKNSHAFQRGALVNRRPFNLIWLQKMWRLYKKSKQFDYSVYLQCLLCTSFRTVFIW